MKIINKNFLLWLGLFMTVTVSCDLEEEPYSQYTADTFYQDEPAIFAGMASVYRTFATSFNFNSQYRAFELSADLLVVHGKITGIWDNGQLLPFCEHTWDADAQYLDRAWNALFTTVGQANFAIVGFEESGLAVDGPIAEMRALRAIAYFHLLDGFGDVPLYTSLAIDPENFPVNTPRAEVFDFVVNELEAASEVLPSKADTEPEYYGRLTKEAVYGILASIYLNAEIYTGTSQYNKAAEYADLVINSGNYSLLPVYHDNFAYDSDNNNEVLFAGIMSREQAGGLGQTFVTVANFQIAGGLFGLPITPQNGFAARPQLYDLFEPDDDRRTSFFYYGDLVDPTTGDTVMVERVIPDNTSIIYRPGISTEGPVPFNSIPATSLRLQPYNAGIKFIKWGIDPTTPNGSSTADVQYLRYADVLLTKAETILRGGGSGDALALVNEVRARSNATALSSVTLDDILDERARELYFEGLGIRRRDLLRFGRFTDPWEFKVETGDPNRELFPIPSSALIANPRLVQNPGY